MFEFQKSDVANGMIRRGFHTELGAREKAVRFALRRFFSSFY